MISLCRLVMILDLILISVYVPFADTVKPTARIAAATWFTNASRVPVNISFSEPCGGFRCSSVNACNVSRCSARTRLRLNSILLFLSV